MADSRRRRGCEGARAISRAEALDIEAYGVAFGFAVGLVEAAGVEHLELNTPITINYLGSRVIVDFSDGHLQARVPSGDVLSLPFGGDESDGVIDGPDEEPDDGGGCELPLN